METKQHISINANRFMTSLAEDMNERYLDIHSVTSINMTIDSEEFEGELVDNWYGTELDLSVSFHVETDEPHYTEAYPIIEGTVKDDTLTYKFYYNTYTEETTWGEVN